MKSNTCNGNRLCPVCGASKIKAVRKIEAYDYYECSGCDVWTIDPLVIEDIDNGASLRLYNESYWESELGAAKERARGPCIARMAESLYYVQIPVSTFIDIGTGPGYFLDAVAAYLPDSKHVFHGIEKFPPPASFRSKSPNYQIGSLLDFKRKADCGICVEVIEHLTPIMMKSLLAELAAVSNRGALYIFNSGQPSFVKREDPSYLDPMVRGHIVCYSINAVKHLAEPLGFTVHVLPGKKWAMALEYFPTHCRVSCPLPDRIWHALPQNLALLKDFNNGDVLRILGLESARAYHD